MARSVPYGQGGTRSLSIRWASSLCRHDPDRSKSVKGVATTYLIVLGTVLGWRPLNGRVVGRTVGTVRYRDIKRTPHESRIYGIDGLRCRVVPLSKDKTRLFRYPSSF